MLTIFSTKTTSNGPNTSCLRARAFFYLLVFWREVFFLLKAWWYHSAVMFIVPACRLFGASCWVRSAMHLWDGAICERIYCRVLQRCKKWGHDKVPCLQRTIKLPNCRLVQLLLTTKNNQQFQSLCPELIIANIFLVHYNILPRRRPASPLTQRAVLRLRQWLRGLWKVSVEKQITLAHWCLLSTTNERLSSSS